MEMILMFCINCGSEIPDVAKFCNKCGKSVVTSGKPGTPDGQNRSQCILTITRNSQFFLINPAIHILIDDKITHKINNGQSIQIPISHGMHKIIFSASIRKKVVDINIHQNETLYVFFDRLTGGIDVSRS
jgi:hypothetical protein